MPPSLEALRHSFQQQQQQQQQQHRKKSNQDPNQDQAQKQKESTAAPQSYSVAKTIPNTEQKSDRERPSKQQKHSHPDQLLPLFQRTSDASRQSTRLTFDFSANNFNDPNKLYDMSDGKNEARALRVLEIMNDFRTLQVHITSLVSRPEATPPDQASQYLEGYAVLRQCNAQAQAILATRYSPGSLGIEPGRSVPDTEVQKATLQRIILDASTRRFQAHKIYLTAAAGMRWIQTRQQIIRSNNTADKKAQAMRAIDARLDTEINDITDESVVNDLRGADRRKNYWIEEDPSLERMLAWIRRQR